MLHSHVNALMNEVLPQRPSPSLLPFLFAFVSATLGVTVKLTAPSAAQALTKHRWK